MTKRAILVVDLQKDYLATGRFPLTGIDPAIARAASIVAAARQAGELVVTIRHEGPADAPFFAAGTTGADLVAEMVPREGEPVVVKAYPNAFRETGLDALLREAQIDAVTIVGAMSHMCIDATARAAADLGYATVVVEDACATRDLDFQGQTVPAAQVHAAFMSALAFAYAQVLSSATYLARPAATAR